MVWWGKMVGVMKPRRWSGKCPHFCIYQPSSAQKTHKHSTTRTELDIFYKSFIQKKTSLFHDIAYKHDLLSDYSLVWRKNTKYNTNRNGAGIRKTCVEIQQHHLTWGAGWRRWLAERVPVTQRPLSASVNSGEVYCICRKPITVRNTHLSTDS